MPYRVPKHLLTARAAFQDHEKSRIQGLAHQRRHRLPLLAEDAGVTPDTAQKRMEKLAEANWQSNFLSTRLTFNKMVGDFNRVNSVLNQDLEKLPHNEQRKRLITFADQLRSDAEEIAGTPIFTLPRSTMRHLLGQKTPSKQVCLKQDRDDYRLSMMQMCLSDLQVTVPVMKAVCDMLLDMKQEKVATASTPAQKVPLLPMPPRA